MRPRRAQRLSTGHLFPECFFFLSIQIKIKITVSLCTWTILRICVGGIPWTHAFLSSSAVEIPVKVSIPHWKGSWMRSKAELYTYPVAQGKAHGRTDIGQSIFSHSWLSSLFKTCSNIFSISNLKNLLLLTPFSVQYEISSELNGVDNSIYQQVIPSLEGQHSPQLPVRGHYSGHKLTHLRIR